MINLIIISTIVSVFRAANTQRNQKWSEVGKKGLLAKSHCKELSGSNLKTAFPEITNEHLAIVKAHFTAALCWRQLFSYTEIFSIPVNLLSYSVSSILKKILYRSLNFLCFVSARGELSWNVLFKSSQLILIFGRKEKGRKLNLMFKNVFCWSLWTWKLQHKMVLKF